MSRYQHTKGQIKDNAIEALLHDPLFRQRVEKIRKERQLHAKRKTWQSGELGGQWQKVNHFFTTGLLLSDAC